MKSINDGPSGSKHGGTESLETTRKLLKKWRKRVRVERTGDIKDAARRF